MEQPVWKARRNWDCGRSYGHEPSEGCGLLLRRTFTDILKGRGIDPIAECRRLYCLVYEQSFNGVMEASFHEMPFRGTAIDLDGFERECGLA